MQPASVKIYFRRHAFSKRICFSFVGGGCGESITFRSACNTILRPSLEFGGVGEVEKAMSRCKGCHATLSDIGYETTYDGLCPDCVFDLLTYIRGEIKSVTWLVNRAGAKDYPRITANVARNRLKLLQTAINEALEP